MSLAIVLYPHARPKLEKDNVDGGKGCIIKLDRGFDFPGAEYLEDCLVHSATYGEYGQTRKRDTYFAFWSGIQWSPKLEGDH